MSEEGGASFNMSVMSLQRIDSVMWKISKAALDKDYEMWDTAVKHLRRETSAYLKPKTFDEISEDISELDKLEWVEVDKEGRRKVVESKIKEVAKALDDITIKLQRACFASGILMAKTQNTGLSVVTT
jgi:hypothetical protein